MKKSIYAIRDDKMESFGVPVIIENDAVAIRQFGDVLSKGDSVMTAHPEDFTIYCLGSYDSVDGRFENFDIPRKLANGADFGSKE